MSLLAPVITGETCEIPARQENTVVSLRLVKTDHWRFDDVFVDTSGGIKIDLCVSYIKAHPLIWWTHAQGSEIFGAFLKGVPFGLGGYR